MKKKTQIGLCCCAAVLIGAAALGHTLRCVSCTVESEKITGSVRIAFLSDVHDSLYGKGQGELIEAIEKFGADLVLFGGDLFDEYSRGENSLTLAGALAKRHPCFYTIGNHEFRTGKAKEYKAEMSRRGITVLSDGSAAVTVNGQELLLCGAETLGDGILQNAQTDERFSILLYHYPSDFPKTSGLGFDLILAGHAHGGQWRIPGLINGLYAPDEGLFPEYAGGRYEKNGTIMLVSRGLYRRASCFLIPRIFNNPELLLITITGK